MDFTMRLILLNLLTLLFSFPIITLIPSLVANCDTVKQYIEGSTSNIIHPFWTAFKKHFKKTVLISVLVAVAGLMLLNSATYFSDNMISGTIYLFGFYITMVIISAIIIIFVHFPLVCIYFRELRLKDYLRLAAMFSLKDIILSIGMALIYGIFIFLSYRYVPILIIGGISFPVYINLKMSRKLYYHISKKYE
jgi:uncharacterized membrane protein YesL